MGVEWILFILLSRDSTDSQVILMEDQRACEYAKRQIKELNDTSPFYIRAVCFPTGTIPLPTKIEK